ncbi:ATP-binding protein [Actinoplanes sp. TFC3]|uniref:AAA family ATPase n=1 Tax=Actinoplanes sp. TFC3 TaxID=1710355 RepID=UPI0008302E72|nr:ATP-binding protein [Actinoplanes sp. TFC3]
MDDRAAQFVEVFQAFLSEVVSEHRGRSQTGEATLGSLVRAHLGVDPRLLPVVSEEVPNYRFADLDIALVEIEQAGTHRQIVGVGGGEQRRHQSLSEIVAGWYPVGAVDYRTVSTGPDETREVISFGLRLFTYEQSPVVVFQRGADPRLGNAAQMEILTPIPGTAASLVATVRRLMLERSALRGQVLTLGGSDFEPGVGALTFHRRPKLAPQDIVLPDGVLQRLHRHVAGVARHRDRLTAAGQHLKRGLLLYGPPGTGKTHTVRYLIGALPELTVILLSGHHIQYVSEAAQMARALQPALVVLEDCDLVAENRDHYPGAQPLLFEVLEALDGLSDDADVAFLLTTNRVDVLEPALAQRPGRVDLAVEVPLPSRTGRLLLLQRYAHGLPFTGEALGATADGTEGATASFIKELVRRAVLIAAEDERDADDRDLAQALSEMRSEAQNVTRSLLGVTAGDDAE